MMNESINFGWGRHRVPFTVSRANDDRAAYYLYPSKRNHGICSKLFKSEDHWWLLKHKDKLCLRRKQFVMSQLQRTPVVSINILNQSHPFTELDKIHFEIHLSTNFHQLNPPNYPVFWYWTRLTRKVVGRQTIFCIWQNAKDSPGINLNFKLRLVV